MLLPPHPRRLWWRDIAAAVAEAGRLLDARGSAGGMGMGSGAIKETQGDHLVSLALSLLRAVGGLLSGRSWRRKIILRSSSRFRSSLQSPGAPWLLSRGLRTSCLFDRIGEGGEVASHLRGRAGEGGGEGGGAGEEERT
jgi:hypothetical protein